MSGDGEGEGEREEAVCICWDTIVRHPYLGWLHVATGKRGCLGLRGSVARPREKG